MVGLTRGAIRLGVISSGSWFAVAVLLSWVLPSRANAQPGWHATAAARAGVTDNSAGVATGQAGSITDTFFGARVEGGYEMAADTTKLRGSYNAALNFFSRDQRTSVIQTLALQSDTRLGPTADLGFEVSGQYGLIGDFDTLMSPAGQGPPVDLGTETARPSGSVKVVRGAVGNQLVWRFSPRWTLDQRLQAAWFSPSGRDFPLQTSASGSSDNVVFRSWTRQTLGLRGRADALRAYPRTLSSQVRLDGRDLATLLTAAVLTHRFTPLWEGHAEAGPLFLFPDEGPSSATYAGRLGLHRMGWTGSNLGIELLRGARPNPLIGEIFITDRLLARYGQPLHKLNGFEMRFEGGVQREQTLPSLGQEPVRLRVAYATASVGYGISRHLSVSLNYQLRVQRTNLASDVSVRFPSYTRNLFFISLEGRVPHAAAGAPLER